MSKCMEWSLFEGEGELICGCDLCGRELRFPFRAADSDYEKIAAELTDIGWLAAEVDGRWEDFCSRECYEKGIKKDDIQGGDSEAPNGRGLELVQDMYAEYGGEEVGNASDRGMEETAG